MRILFFSKYNAKGPSSRYRIFQYLNLYKKNGFDYKLNYLLGDWYFTNLPKWKIIHRIIFSYLYRFFFLFTIKKNDIVYIEYELFPFFPSLFEKSLSFFNIKYIVDYDDAVFHTYNLSSNYFVKKLLNNKIDNVIKYANTVITGSPYLTNYAEKLNKNVIEIPTSLDLKIYNCSDNIKKNTKFTIGWIGSKSTSVNILSLIDVFKRLTNVINFQINLIGFDNTLKHHFKNIDVNFIDWNAENEVIEIKKFDVGIMPLNNNLWNKGKCGFKLIQYMACSLPTISTPLDANLKINRGGENIFANSDDEWYNAIINVSINKFIFENVGKNNHSIFKKYYSSQANLKFYLAIFNSLY